MLQPTHHGPVSAIFIFKKRPSSSQRTRTLFGFSRKTGNAVLRNRFKRRIREIVRLHAKTVRPLDLFFAAKRPLSTITNDQWKKERARIKEWCENL